MLVYFALDITFGLIQTDDFRRFSDYVTRADVGK
jgi:hypothetical protein